ncbi:MAG TPA: hypothetical protein VFW04_08845 [Gemmatimonadaceae bacterium]|nr:hypothetical protein [Gemmatimonadaceae bacterium]
MKKVLLSWSSGKDSAWTLHVLRQRADIDVVALLTTFNADADRVAMHAVRRDLVRAQAEQAGLPLWEVDLPWPCTNDDYESRMRAVCERALANDIAAVAFGDLFLADVRAYRETQLAGTGLEPLFPLWNAPTAELAREMIAAGVKARISCVDPSQIARSFAGREFDAALLAELPATADPCGEKGEFHTFVYDAPVFTGAIDVRSGVIVERDGFVFADVFSTPAP